MAPGQSKPLTSLPGYSPSAKSAQEQLSELKGNAALINAHFVNFISNIARQLRVSANDANVHFEDEIDREFTSPEVLRRAPDSPEPIARDDFVRAEGFEKELLDFEKSPLANLDISRIRSDLEDGSDDDGLNDSHLILRQPDSNAEKIQTTTSNCNGQPAKSNANSPSSSDETNYLQLPPVDHRINRIYERVSIINQELNAKLDKVKEEAENSKSACRELQERNATLENQLATARKELQALRSENQILKSKDTQATRTQLTAITINELNEKIALFKRTIVSKDEVISSLEKRVQGLLNRISSKKANSEVDELNARIRDLQGQVSTCNKKVKGKEAEIKSLLETIGKQASEIVALEFKLQQKMTPPSPRESSRSKSTHEVIQPAIRTRLNFTSHMSTLNGLNGHTASFVVRRLVHINKSLVYQKQYLVSVLRGFEETDRVALRMLAMMNSISYESISDLPLNPKGRFKSAVLVIISIGRMKKLVQKWSLAKQNSH